MFRPWYEDNILSPWRKVKTGDKSYTYEKVKHIRSHKDDGLAVVGTRKFGMIETFFANALMCMAINTITKRNE